MIPIPNRHQAAPQQLPSDFLHAYKEWREKHDDAYFINLLQRRWEKYSKNTIVFIAIAVLIYGFITFKTRNGDWKEILFMQGILGFFISIIFIAHYSYRKEIRKDLSLSGSRINIYQCIQLQYDTAGEDRIQLKRIAEAPSKDTLKTKIRYENESELLTLYCSTRPPSHYRSKKYPFMLLLESGMGKPISGTFFFDSVNQIIQAGNDFPELSYYSFKND